MDRPTSAQRLLWLGVQDRDLTRQLRRDLELLPGIRRDDPAAAIIYEHARRTSDELASARTAKDEVRAERADDEFETWAARLENEIA